LGGNGRSFVDESFVAKKDPGRAGALNGATLALSFFLPVAKWTTV
jgi:hypothetical protein